MLITASGLKYYGYSHVVVSVNCFEDSQGGVVKFKVCRTVITTCFNFLLLLCDCEDVISQKYFLKTVLTTIVIM